MSKPNGKILTMQQPRQGAHVEVSVPIYDSVPAKTFMCFMAMQDHLSRNPPPGLRQFGWRYRSQSGISMSRHALLVCAIKAGASHILWLDADMIFPPDTLDRLLAHRLPFVGANCVRRAEPFTWTAQDKDGKEVSSVGKTGVEEVGYLGFGVTMIDLSVFNRIHPPFFNFEWLVDNAETGAGHYQGEDIYLCEKLGREGIHPHIDHDLSRQIKHIGRIEVGYEWAAGWAEANPSGAMLDPAAVRPDRAE